MDVVGIMLMWLVGIVFFPIIVYIVWKIYKYICTLSIKNAAKYSYFNHCYPVNFIYGYVANRR